MSDYGVKIGIKADTGIMLLKPSTVSAVVNVVVEIDWLPRPICLINCYMPTFGYSDTSEKFQDNLDLLEVIIQKYCESHQIILVG